MLPLSPPGELIGGELRSELGVDGGVENSLAVGDAFSTLLLTVISNDNIDQKLRCIKKKTKPNRTLIIIAVDNIYMTGDVSLCRRLRMNQVVGRMTTTRLE